MEMDTILWHEYCLKNKKKYLLRLKEELQSKSNEVQESEKQIEFYALQIKIAIEKKKFKFKTNLFLRKRGTKNKK